MIQSYREVKMMHYQNWISNPSLPIAIDTSVAINLLASGCAEKILKAIPNPVLAIDVVLQELEDGRRRRGRPDAELFQQLQTAGLVEIVELDERGELVFSSLVIGPASATLDDGEAATIAYALSAGTAAVIDDGKAIRICTEKYPRLPRGSSTSLFSHPCVVDAVGHDGLAIAVLNALRQARMRVLPEYQQWVVGLIGVEQARQCSSLSRALRISADSSR